MSWFGWRTGTNAVSEPERTSAMLDAAGSAITRNELCELCAVHDAADEAAALSLLAEAMHRDPALHWVCGAANKMRVGDAARFSADKMWERCRAGGHCVAIRSRPRGGAGVGAGGGSGAGFQNSCSLTGSRADLLISGASGTDASLMGVALMLPPDKRPRRMSLASAASAAGAAAIGTVQAVKGAMWGDTAEARPAPWLSSSGHSAAARGKECATSTNDDASWVDGAAVQRRYTELMALRCSAAPAGGSNGTDTNSNAMGQQRGSSGGSGRGRTFAQNGRWELVFVAWSADAREGHEGQHVCGVGESRGGDTSSSSIGSSSEKGSADGNRRHTAADMVANGLTVVTGRISNGKQHANGSSVATRPVSGLARTTSNTEPPSARSVKTESEPSTPKFEQSDELSSAASSARALLDRFGGLLDGIEQHLDADEAHGGGTSSKNSTNGGDSDGNDDNGHDDSDGECGTGNSNADDVDGNGRACDDDNTGDGAVGHDSDGDDVDGNGRACDDDNTGDSDASIDSSTIPDDGQAGNVDGSQSNVVLHESAIVQDADDSEGTRQPTAKPAAAHHDTTDCMQVSRIRHLHVALVRLLIFLGDRDGVPVWFNSSICSQQEKRLWARHQFKCIDTQALGDDGACLTVFVREPYRVVRPRARSTPVHATQSSPAGSSVADTAPSPARAACSSPRQPQLLPSLMHEFFAFQPPPTTIPRHRAQWVDAVLATWRTIAEDNRTGAALIRAVRDEVNELEKLQRKLFGVTCG